MMSADSLELSDIKFLLGTLKRRKEYLEAVWCHLFIIRIAIYCKCMKGKAAQSYSHSLSRKREPKLLSCFLIFIYLLTNLKRFPLSNIMFLIYYKQCFESWYCWFF